LWHVLGDLSRTAADFKRKPNKSKATHLDQLILSLV